MLKKILIGVIAVIVVFVGIVLVQPSSYEVVRATTITAPAAVPYALVSDFKKWPDWSPWEELDPTMQKTITGEAATVGSKYHWNSPKDDVGEGEMIITAITPEKSIAFDLNFIKPFAANNKTTFAFETKGNVTEVIWKMTGPKNFMMKAVMLFMDVEGMVGKDFEKGLAKIKTVSETAQSTAAAAAPPAPAASATPASK